MCITSCFPCSTVFRIWKPKFPHLHIRLTTSREILTSLLKGISAQLADHTLARTYECIVVGNLREDSGTVDAPIARDSRDRKRMAVVHGGRRAVTHWTVLARYPGYTHVQCRLETGRTHQIRVHMAYLGHPILGDTVYGAKKPVPGLTGQCLHAVGLQFIHPRTKELVSLSCPLPGEFTAALRKIDR